MAAQFSVLASGSSGNCAIIRSPRSGLLIDFGLGHRAIAGRFRALGIHWSEIHAAILTHTHGDHWRREILPLLLRNRIPLYCHLQHLNGMWQATEELRLMRNAGLLHHFISGDTMTLPNGMTVYAHEVAHDSYPTFAFRVDASTEWFADSWSLGYASDLGCWDAALVEALRGVDVLAVEFNHDIALEHQSRRPPHLVERVLGNEGHLSNEQAADFYAAIVDASEGIAPAHLVQLHLSRECNQPILAVKAAQAIMRQRGITSRIHTANQNDPLPFMSLSAQVRPLPVQRRTPRSPLQQMRLPGFEDGVAG